MKFFEEQEKARAKSRRLVVLFVLMLLAMELILNGAMYFMLKAGIEKSQIFSHVHNRRVRANDSMEGLAGDGQEMPKWPFLFITAGSLTVILTAAGLQASALKSGGGSRVAELSGGEEADPSDPLEKRLVNVVEEMSLASGTPQPRVYVMRNEMGINAFAAGWGPEDAVVCVTRGCLEGLTRDELQGVVAHEFSHIFNADMRINIRAMAMLFGLYALAIAGRVVFDLGRLDDDRDSKIGVLLLLLGGTLVVLGWVGQMLGHVLSAAISREREYLADASAVQFTRNPDGIGGALRKIAGASYGGGVGSQVMAPKAMAMSHMFFGSGSSSFSGGVLSILDTHPPLESRIKKVYGRSMGFLMPLATSQSRFYQSSSMPDESNPSMGGQAGMAAVGLKASAQTQHTKTSAGLAAALSVERGEFGTVVVAVPPETDLKSECGKTIPALVRSACSDRSKVGSLCLALIAASQPTQELKKAALASVAKRFGQEESDAVAGLISSVEQFDMSLHVAVLDLCAAALKGLPEEKKKSILAAMVELAKLDGKVSMREQALFQVAKRRMQSQVKMSGNGVLADHIPEAAKALAWVARRASDNEDKAMAYYIEALASLGPRKDSQGWEVVGKGEQAPNWAELDALAPMQKPALAKGLCKAAGSQNEPARDACRIACALLGCPAPYAQNS